MEITKEKYKEILEIQMIPYNEKSRWFEETLTKINQALQLQQAGVISNEMEVCDCEIPKPIDPFHEIDKQVCKDCSGFIEQTYL